MKNFIRSVARREEGASLVEFALVAPMLILLLVGLIEIGRFTALAIMASNAARAGVQYGAQDLQTAQDSAGIQAAAVADGQNLSNWTSSTGGVTVAELCSVNGATPATCSAAGSGAPMNTVYYVKVQVTGKFTPLIHYPGLSNAIPVSGSAIMRVGSQ
jgi:Flp pilus assembly protein TadG